MSRLHKLRRIVKKKSTTMCFPSVHTDNLSSVAYRIVFLLTSQQSPFPDQTKQVKRRSEVCSLAGRCETMEAACRYVAHLPALMQTLFTRSSRFQRIFPTPQEALDAWPIDEPLHRELILSSLHRTAITLFLQRSVLLDEEGPWETTLSNKGVPVL